MTIIEEISDERDRQKTGEGWSEKHDDGHRHGELAQAAAAYALTYRISNPEKMWPWSRLWFKPKDHRRNCIRAAALLIAEIERLDRLRETSR